jgi:hypothetical protein
MMYVGTAWQRLGFDIMEFNGGCGHVQKQGGKSLINMRMRPMILYT